MATEIKPDNYDTLLSPIITEKSTLVAEENKVIFRVPLTATKPQIKEAVEALFKVEVEGVNTLRVKGKTKRFRGIRGRRSDFKKAIVTLKDGQSVDITTGL
ncbi:MAG: 50S ribosomal protein L23 [Pseudomonadota bacterium]